MITLTINVDDWLAERVQQHAIERKTTIDSVVSDALSQHMSVGKSDLVAFLERAWERGWKSDGAGYLSDDEMYSR